MPYRALSRFSTPQSRRGLHLAGVLVSLSCALLHCASSDSSSDAQPGVPDGGRGEAVVDVDVDVEGGVTVPDGGAPLGDGAVAVEGPGAPLAPPTVFTGSQHTCAIKAGRVKCWGLNFSGQLGNGMSSLESPGDAPGEMGAALVAVDLGAARTATALALGRDYTCALLDNGSVKCWGANDDGQLGQDDAVARGGAAGPLGDGLPAVNLGEGRKATAIASGSAHVCVILDDASAKCWGANSSGQLGQGDDVTRGNKVGDMAGLLPIALPAGRTVIRLAAGSDTTCLLLDDASVRCLGANISGQLGLGDTLPRGKSPSHLGAGLTAADLGPGTVLGVTVGTGATCVSLEGGSVKCWGRNTSGQLGVGSINPSGDYPKDMGAKLRTTDLGPGAYAVKVAGGNGFACALLKSGNLKCWGLNTSGQLGLGDKLPRGAKPGEMGAALTPLSLGTNRTAVELSVGSAHACVRLDDGAYKCWGDNSNGKLGLGDKPSRGLKLTEMGDALPAIDVGP